MVGFSGRRGSRVLMARNATERGRAPSSRPGPRTADRPGYAAPRSGSRSWSAYCPIAVGSGVGSTRRPSDGDVGARDPRELREAIGDPRGELARTTTSTARPRWRDLGEDRRAARPCPSRRGARAAPAPRSRRTCRPLAGVADRPDARPDQGPPRPAGRPPGDLPRHPRRRHQRQDVDGPDDRRPAARLRAARRAVHLARTCTSITERIAFEGGPIDLERFLAAWDEVAPYVDLVDSRHEHRLSFFEVAHRAWRTRPSPRRRSTSPSSRSGSAARGTPPTSPTRRRGRHLDRDGPPGLPRRHPRADRGGEGRDHQGRQHRRPRPAGRSRRPRCCCGAPSRSAAAVAREGFEFGVVARSIAVGGQLLTLKGLGGTYDDVFLPAARGAPGAQRRGGRWRPSRRSSAAGQAGWTRTPYVRASPR